jgi:Rrf2 family protein
MKISSKTRYGLRAMAYLAKSFKDKKFCSLKEISQAEQIPFDYLEKILAQLKKKKLIKTKKGSRGGYILAKRPQKIYLNEIVAALEDMEPVKCSLCQRKKICLTKNFWEGFQESIQEFLSSVNLKDLAD